MEITESECYNDKKRYEERKKELEEIGRSFKILIEETEPFLILIELEAPTNGGQQIKIYKRELFEIEPKDIWCAVVDGYGVAVWENEEIPKRLDISYERFLQILKDLHKSKMFDSEEVVNDTGQHELLIFQYSELIEQIESISN